MDIGMDLDMDVDVCADVCVDGRAWRRRSSRDHVAAPITYGCSLTHVRLQPHAHTVAAPITYGCSLTPVRLQAEQLRVISEFRGGAVNVLVATDVAAMLAGSASPWAVESFSRRL